ncbi:MAG: TIGR03086 family metal-binding protein [Propioniciclava sp.]
MNASDPRPQFATAGAIALAVVRQVTPDDLNRPTPCTEFTVRDLLGHMIGVLRRPLALARGTDALAVPLVVSDIADEALATTFATDLDDAIAAWADDALLDQAMSLPWVQGLGRGMLATYIPELTVHTWDLAQAIGVQPDWDVEVVEASLESASTFLPEGPRAGVTLPNGVPIPFADAVPVGPDASGVDRLIAAYGRQPAPATSAG